MLHFIQPEHAGKFYETLYFRSWISMKIMNCSGKNCCSGKLFRSRYEFGVYGAKWYDNKWGLEAVMITQRILKKRRNPRHKTTYHKTATTNYQRNISFLTTPNFFLKIWYLDYSTKSMTIKHKTPISLHLNLINNAIPLGTYERVFFVITNRQLDSPANMEHLQLMPRSSELNTFGMAHTIYRDLFWCVNVFRVTVVFPYRCLGI